jgi:glutamine amidotransferase
MIRLFGYMANEPDRIRCALLAARDLLRVDTGPNPDGWGIGFFQGGEVLLQKRPKAAPGVVDFYGQVKDLRTDVVVGHVRTATVGVAQKNENTHPFRYRSWLFAHSGTLPRFADIKDEIVSSIPDFLRRNIRGETDSEHLFHLFLAFLHDGGKLEDPLISAHVARGAMRATAAFVDKLAGSAGGGANHLNIVATNGRILLATRRGAPMSIYKVSAIADCSLCRDVTATPGREARRVSHEHLRAVLLASDGDTPRPGFEPIPDASVVTVTHHIQAEIAPLRETSA